MAHVVPPPAGVYAFDTLEFGDWCEVHGRSPGVVSTAVSRWHKKNLGKRLTVKPRYDGVVIVRRIA